MNLLQESKLWVARFDALSKRERIVVAGVTALVMVMLVQWLVVDPLLLDRQRLQRELVELNSRTQAQQVELDTIMRRHETDPDREEKLHLAALEQEQAELDRRLREHMRGLVEPEQMAVVLERVLSQKTPLRLHQVRSLAPVPLVTELPAVSVDAVTPEAPTNEPAAVEAGIFRHGLEIEFRGSYLATLNYLKALEALPWDFYWDGVSLDIEKYPHARVVITVHTLSLKEGWIGV